MNSVFKNSKPVVEKLLLYGFLKKSKIYQYSTDILDGDFSLKVIVEEPDRVSTKLYDNISGELYTLHLMDSAEGPFVGQIREEYFRVLNDIFSKCFEKSIFNQEYSLEIIKYVKTKYGDDAEYLWEKFPDNAIVRRNDNKKWYLAILTVNQEKLGKKECKNIEILDIKADKDEIPLLINNLGYFPAYHMNKKSWITVLLDGTVPLNEILKRIDKSYMLAG